MAWPSARTFGSFTFSRRTASASASASPCRPSSASRRARNSRAPTRSSTLRPDFAPSAARRRASPTSPRYRLAMASVTPPSHCWRGSSEAWSRLAAASACGHSSRSAWATNRAVSIFIESSGCSFEALSSAPSAASVRPWLELEERDVLVAGGAVRVLGDVGLEDLARRLRPPGRDVGLGEAHVGAGEGHPPPAQLLEVDEGLRVAPQVEERLGEVVPRRGVVGGLVHRLLVGRHRLLDRGGVERVVASLDVEALAGREVAGLRHRLRRVGPGLVHVAEVPVHDRQLGEGHGEAGVRLDRLLEVGPGLLLAGGRASRLPSV